MALLLRFLIPRLQQRQQIYHPLLNTLHVLVAELRHHLPLSVQTGNRDVNGRIAVFVVGGLLC